MSDPKPALMSLSQRSTGRQWSFPLAGLLSWCSFSTAFSDHVSATLNAVLVLHNLQALVLGARDGFRAVSTMIRPLLHHPILRILQPRPTKAGCQDFGLVLLLVAWGLISSTVIVSLDIRSPGPHLGIGNANRRTAGDAEPHLPKIAVKVLLILVL